MPELPEVETIRNHLKPNILGKVISKIDVLEPKIFIGDSTKAEGKRVIDVLRSGKVLSIELETGLFLSFHFKLSGQLLFAHDSQNAVYKDKIPGASSNKMPSSSTRVIIHFADNSAIYFNEVRKFGWIKFSDIQEKPKGVDVMSKKFTKEYFEKNLANTRRPIKVVLMDQDRYAGIGNIYANEALWEAKIDPSIPPQKLTESQINKLHQAIINAIQKGIKHQGSSGNDEMYVLPDGSKGGFQYQFVVYQQNGKPCPRCGEIIKRIKLGGRGTFFCPKCQSNSI